MSQKGKITGLVVIILIALGFIVKQFSIKSQPMVYENRNALVDIVANKAFVTASPPQSYPSESPYSDGKNVYQANICKSCGTIFALKVNPISSEVNPEEMLARMMLSCPACNSEDIDAFVMPEGQNEMDLPGPVQLLTLPRAK